MFSRVYVWLLALLRIRQPITLMARLYADRNPTEFGVLMALSGAGLAALVVHVGGPVAWIVVAGCALLYGHIFWGGYRFRG